MGKRIMDTAMKMNLVKIDKVLCNLNNKAKENLFLTSRIYMIVLRILSNIRKQKIHKHKMLNKTK